jgi:membrane-associated phospholipid phosphatase
MHPLLQTLPKIVRKIYTGKYLYFQALACLLTFICVMGGLDWSYFVFMQDKPWGDYLSPAVLIGFFAPMFIPAIPVVIGNLFQKKKLSLYGWMLWQAAFLGWFVSSLYKAFTGRIQPDLFDTVTDISHSFQFGVLHHGIFWGWPSSHTSAAFAVAFSIIATTKNRLLQAVSFLCALYIGVGVSFSIHWFSEFLAGALIGGVIGHAVGKTWKHYFA